MDKYNIIIFYIEKIIYIIFGCIELYYVFEYKNLFNNCSNIIEFVTIYAIILFISRIGVILLDINTNKIYIKPFFYIIQLLFLILECFMLNVYYTIPETCQKFWINNAPEILTLFYVQIILTWIYFGLFTFLVFLIFIGKCLIIINNINNDDSSTDTNITEIGDEDEIDIEYEDDIENGNEID